MTKLFIDDKRNPPDDSWVVVRSYDEFVKYMEENNMPHTISFDHDLGIADGKDGYSCAQYLLKRVENTYQMPEVCLIHSMNPVGRANIQFLISNCYVRLRQLNSISRKVFHKL